MQAVHPEVWNPCLRVEPSRKQRRPRATCTVRELSSSWHCFLPQEDTETSEKTAKNGWEISRRFWRLNDLHRFCRSTWRVLVLCRRHSAVNNKLPTVGQKSTKLKWKLSGDSSEDFLNCDMLWCQFLHLEMSLLVALPDLHDLQSLTMFLLVSD